MTETSYPWFKFNVTKWMLGRIQRLSFTHHGAFLRLICLYWDKDGEITLEDAELDCTPELFSDLLKFKIVKNRNGFVQIDFMDELLSEKTDSSSQKRDAALERWRLDRERKRIASEQQVNADAMHVHKDAMQIREEEKREEEKREDKTRKEQTKGRVSKILAPESKELFEALKIHFGFNEINYMDKIRELDSFCCVLQSKNQIQYFITQFSAYSQYKKKASERVHLFAGFIGTLKEQYQDGGWCADNWEHKLNNFKDNEKSNKTGLHGADADDYIARKLASIQRNSGN